MSDSTNKIKEEKEKFSENKFYEDEFDLRELFFLIWTKRKALAFTGVVFCLSFMFYSLTIPDTYSSDSLLRINDTESASSLSNLTSRYSGLAAMAGVSLQTQSNSKADLVMATIKSREFFQHLSTFDGVISNLYAARGYDEGRQATIYDLNIFNPEEGGWQVTEPTFMEVHDNFLQSLIVSQDPDNEFIYLAVVHLSPKFSYNLCELVLREVNNLIKKRKVEESQKALNFLNEQLAKGPKLEIKQSITQLLEAQLQIQMIAKVREDYMLTPIDKAFIPLEKSGPNRLKISLLGLILGLGIGIFVVLFRSYFSTKK